MDEGVLRESVGKVPPGRWAVGVSGGADSVALLRLLEKRADLSLHVVHLDHETRSGESTLDAAFVVDLAKQSGVPCVVARRSEIEKTMCKLPANRSARFRAVRMQLFKRTIESESLSGVILAHHADDQAETILQRLLRGSGPPALSGMAERTVVSGVMVLRPLLSDSSHDLRQFLRSRNQPWREDRSNRSQVYLRNRIRPIVENDRELRQSLLTLGGACAAYRDWFEENAPALDNCFPGEQLAELPEPLARWSAGKWLELQGAPAGRITRRDRDRLIEMARDAASVPRRHFPGKLLVCRKGGKIFVDGHPE